MRALNGIFRATAPRAGSPWHGGAVVLIALVYNSIVHARPATAPTTAPSAWAFHGGGPLLGGAPELSAPPMKLRWTYHTDEEGSGGIDGAAVISNGCVYVGDGKGLLHAIDLSTGKRRWVYHAEDGFAATPLVLGDRVFIGDLSGTFHAVSEKGEKLWTVETAGTIHASANASATDADRIIVTNDAGKILCLNSASGETIWKAQAGDRVNGASAIANGVVYFAGCDAKLLALSLIDGKERFTADLGAVTGGSAAVVGERIVVGTDGGRVLCMSTDDGTPIWSYEQIENSAMAYASPAVSDGIVVIGARDRQLHAIELATGKPLWKFKTRLDVDSSPLISAGRVYVGSRDKSLYVLDLKSGQLLWEFKASHSITASPVIGEGVLVIGDSAGNVYCLEGQ
jgi:eukaryotic-like serine/threonine-protein kinase